MTFQFSDQSKDIFQIKQLQETMSINRSSIASAAKHSDKFIKMKSDLSLSKVLDMKDEEPELTIAEQDEATAQLFNEDDGSGWFGLKPAKFDEMLESADTPQIIKDIYSNYYTFQLDCSEINSVEDLDEKFTRQSKILMNVLKSDVEGNNYPREILESQFSTVSPFYRFLTHDNDMQVKYDRVERGLDKQMFDLMLEKMPGFTLKIQEIHHEFQPLQELAFHDKQEAHEDDEEGHQIENKYYSFNMTSYHLFHVGEQQFAVQTIFNSEMQQHQIQFHEVTENNILNPLSDEPIYVRQADDKVKGWLTDKLVSFKIIGERVYFFSLRKNVDHEDKRAESEVEDGGVDSDRGLDNDQIFWRISLKCFNVLEPETGVRVVQRVAFKCTSNEENDGVSDYEYYEALSVFFVHDFASETFCQSTSQENGEADQQLMGEEQNNYIVIFEGVVTPDRKYGTDNLTDAKFHLAKLSDLGKDILLSVSMVRIDEEDPKQSCINIRNPISVMKISGQKHIKAVSNAMGLVEEDEEIKKFEFCEELIFITTFNDGSRGPKDVVKDKRILPDVFSLIFLNDQREAEKLESLPQHRSYLDKKDHDYLKTELAWKRGINKMLENLTYFNNSTETWFDRCRNKFVMQYRSFCRGEFEFFKLLCQHCLPENKKSIFPMDDKIYLGAGKWCEHSLSILSSSINTNKTTGEMTILLHILQDHRHQNACIWKFNINQWNVHDSKAQYNDVNSYQHLLGKIFKDIPDEDNQNDDINPDLPVTLTRGCSSIARVDTRIIQDQSDDENIVSKGIKDPTQTLPQLIGSQIFINLDNEVDQAAFEQSIRDHINNGVKKRISVFCLEQVAFSRVKIFKKDQLEPTELEIKTVKFEDEVTREYIKPLQVTFAEDDREEIPCVVYNVKDQRMTDIAFVLFVECKPHCFIDLQLDNFKFVDSNNFYSQIVLTLSSEILEGKRPKFREDDYEEDDVDLEAYFSQRYQAAIFDPSYSEVQIVEVDVKRFPLRTGKEKRFESCVTGVKDIVFNRPGEFKANLVPLFEVQSTVPDRYDEGKHLSNFRIAGTQLQLLLIDEFDDEQEDWIKKTLTYNLPNPRNLAPLAQDIDGEHEKFTSRNKFTYSRLQEIRDGNHAIIAETFLKGELAQMTNKKIVSDEEMLRIIKNANLVTLNTKLTDITEYMNSKAFLNAQIKKQTRILLQDIFDKDVTKMFSGMEMFNGHAIAENIDEKKLEEYIGQIRKMNNRKQDDLDWIEHPFTEKFPLNSFEKVVRAVDSYDEEDNQQKKFYNHYLRKFKLTGYEIVGFNINLRSLIQTRLEQDDKRCSAMLAKYLQEVQTNNTGKYQQFMSSFPTVIEKQWYHNSVFEIFNDKDVQVEDEIEEEILNEHESSSDSEEEVQPQGIKIRIDLPGNLCTDKGLPTKNDCDHHLSSSDFGQASKVRDYHSDAALKYYIDKVEVSDFNQNGDVPVSYSAIIMRDYVLSKKLKHISQARDITGLEQSRDIKFTQLELAEWINEVVQMNFSEIEDNSIVRDIIDVAFMHTQFVKNIQFFIYMMFHTAPFMVQMFFTKTINQSIHTACCMSMIFCQLFFIIFEFMDMNMRRKGLWDYMKDRENRLDIVSFFFIMFYAFMRVAYVNSYIIEIDDAANDMKLKGWDYWARVLIPLYNFIVYTLTFFKIINYLRVWPAFGNLIELIYMSVDEIKTFIQFMVLWAVYFALSFRILGAHFDQENYSKGYDHDHGDYPLIDHVSVLIFQSIRNSIGDLNVPHYLYWEARFNAGEKVIGASFIYLIWIIWFINVGLMVIMLVNFLIAIVSQVFERISGEQMQTSYKIRAEQNLEVARYSAFLFPETHRDFFVLASATDSNEKSDQEWQGVVKQIKKTLSRQVHYLKKQNSSYMDVTMDKLEKLDGEQDQIREALRRIEEHTRKIK